MEHLLCQRLLELEAYELLAVPDDAAILRLEAGDVQPDAAVVRNRRRALDTATVRRNIHQAHLRLAAAPLTHGRGQVERSAVGAATIRKAISTGFHGISHAESPLKAFCPAMVNKSFRHRGIHLKKLRV